MGQYYSPYVQRGKTFKVFDNHVDGDWQGLKLMEHSWWRNQYVGNVINEIFYKKAHVCWVGDYYAEDDYRQANCQDKEIVKEIGSTTWGNDGKPEPKRIKCTKARSRSLTNYLLVNHTKHEFINGNEYYEHNKVLEKWNDEEWFSCVNPLPLLTCSASHSGGSYYGINKEQCGIWFNDVLEVVEDWDEKSLLEKGYKKVMFEFKEE